jgi:hypothetical protein
VYLTIINLQPPSCWCLLSAQRTGDPLFKLQTRTSDMPQPDALPAQQTNLNLPPNAQFHFCPAKSRFNKGTLYLPSPILDFYLWKFWKCRKIRYKSSPLLRVASPTELSKPLKTISLPITPNLKCFHHNIAELLEEYFGRILFQCVVYQKYCGQ